MNDYLKRITLALSFAAIITLLILITNQLFIEDIPTVVYNSGDKL